MTFNWNPLDEEPFRDNEVEKADPSQMQLTPHIVDDWQELSLGEVDADITNGYDEEDDYTAILSDARLRLEQGKLYEMIMNHDIFRGVDADPKAVRNVQREIRKFAKERMEIMLGMRQEVTPAVNAPIIFPLNDLEIEILKKLASKATNGLTEAADSNTFDSWSKAPKKATLIPISSPARSAPQLTPKPLKMNPPQPQAVQKSAPKAPAQPASTTPRKEAERVAQAEAELAERMTSRKPVANPDATPQPSALMANSIFSAEDPEAKMLTFLKK